MQPYYETQLGKLYHGDCLQIMKELIAEGVKVDLVITDPPYGIDFQSRVRKEKLMKIYNDKNLDWLDEYVYYVNLLMNNDSHIYSFLSWHKIDEFKKTFDKIFHIKNILVWVKNNTGMGDLKGQYAPKYELCIFANKGKGRKLNGSRDPDVINAKKTNNEYHPTQKPTELIKYLCKKSSNKGELVLDCFSGSGTTAIACEQTGRRWICIERERKYCDVTVERLKDIQQTLF